MEPITAFVVTAILVVYARVRNSLTLAGIGAAILTAVAHAFHPWPIFFTLLITFFLAGTFVTKIKHGRKATLTSSSAGGSVPAAPHPRTYVQVFANSLPASIMIVLHALYLDTALHSMPSFLAGNNAEYTVCLPNPRQTQAVFKPNILLATPYGIVAMYAAMAADTFASELGILSKERPRLITNPFKTAPPGTNGAITVGGTVGSALGAFIVALTAAITMPFCDGGETGVTLLEARTARVHGYSMDGITWQKRWSGNEKLVFIGVMTAVGVLGGLLDSLLGALLQASVVDMRSGKIVEGEGGKRVLVSSDKGTDDKGGRKIVQGADILDNNGVNLLMAATIALSATLGAGWLMGIGPIKISQDIAALYPALKERGWF